MLRIASDLLAEETKMGMKSAKPPVIVGSGMPTDGFALSPLDSALQALPRNAPSGLVEPAVSLRAQPTYEFD